MNRRQRNRSAAALAAACALLAGVNGAGAAVAHAEGERWIAFGLYLWASFWGLLGVLTLAHGAKT